MHSHLTAAQLGALSNAASRKSAVPAAWVAASAEIGMYLSSKPDTAADDALLAFGRNFLGPRERELAQLLLRGHSTTSVGLRLGISTTTVKTHRKNLYAKLGIATQFEFFSLFRDSLGHGGGVSEASSSGRMVSLAAVVHNGTRYHYNEAPR